jgi:hypothetical protein
VTNTSLVALQLGGNDLHPFLHQDVETLDRGLRVVCVGTEATALAFIFLVSLKS